MPKKPAARPGDIVEVATPKGLAYVHYAGQHPSYGPMVRVLPGLFTTRPADPGAIEGGYLTFYPLTAAVSQGLVPVVGHRPVPPGGEPVPPLRRAGARSPSGQVLAWVIVRNGQNVLRESLTPEERRMPIASIWNHEALIHQIVTQWRPEQEA